MRGGHPARAGIVWHRLATAVFVGMTELWRLGHGRASSIQHFGITAEAAAKAAEARLHGK